MTDNEIAVPTHVGARELIDNDLQADAHYDPFGGPSVSARLEGMGADGSVTVSSPASGVVQLAPEQAQSLADDLRLNRQSVLVDLFTQEADVDEIIAALEAAAEATEVASKLDAGFIGALNVQRVQGDGDD